MSNGVGGPSHAAQLLAGRGGAALGELLRARQYARELGRDAWRMPVEIDQVPSAPLGSSDLRWLISKGYIEPAEESAGPQEDRRRMGSRRSPVRTETTRLVLTEAGRRFVEHLLRFCAAEALACCEAPSRTDDAHPAAGRPCWDAGRRCLTVGARLVKRYRTLAPSRERILSIFQEQDWPRWIEDPLPACAEQDPKERLCATVKRLNRNQKIRLIRFHCDGTGRGVYWELVEGGE